MGVRKKEMADQLKEERKSIAFAKLNDYPTSPRKMRLVADIIRGKEVVAALNILKFTRKHSALPMEKLLRSAISNWQAKKHRRRYRDCKRSSERDSCRRISHT